MAKIDYRDRAVLMSSGYEPDGQKEIQLYYDRFDKIVYYVNGNGEFFYSDGTTYNPTPIPDGNKLIYTSIINGVVGLKFLNPLEPSSIISSNFQSTNGTITLQTTRENNTLILFSYENSGTMKITSTTENAVGDITTITEIAAIPAPYKAFDTEEELCNYYGNNPTSIPDPDGIIYIDFTQPAAYLDNQGNIGTESLIGKWVYLITPEVPNDFEGGVEPINYYYVYLETSETPFGVGNISVLCAPPSPVAATYSAYVSDGVPFSQTSDACDYYQSVAGEIPYDSVLYLREDNSLWFGDENTAAPNGYYIILNADMECRILGITNQNISSNENAATFCQPEFAQFDGFFDSGLSFALQSDICSTFADASNGVLYYRNSDGKCFSDEGITECGAGFIAFLDTGTWYISQLNSSSVQIGGETVVLATACA